MFEMKDARGADDEILQSCDRDSESETPDKEKDEKITSVSQVYR